MAYPNPNIATSSASWANLQAGGMSNLIERLITVNNVATVAPTSAPTLAASGSAGSLTAATYYVVVTETNGIGETTVSPTSSSQAISGTQSLVVTFPTLKTGNSARNTYWSTSSTGPFTMIATGTTTATLTVSAQPSATNSFGTVNPPTINTTAFTFVDANNNTRNTALSNTRAAERGNLQTVYNQAAINLDRFLRGDPVSFAAVIEKLRHAHTAFQIIAQAFADAGTLVDSNPGTLKPVSTGIGQYTQGRTWP